MGFPSAIKKRLIGVYNSILPNEDIGASKEKWNSLAKENARYFVLSNYGKEISEEAFRQAGKDDYDTLVAHDTLLQERIGDFKKNSVLEIGCGIGRITEFFADNFKEVTGLDISEEMIGLGKKRLADKTNARLIAGNGLIFPLEDSSVDLVFSFIVFQHMPDISTIRSNIKEICRVLKVGGVAKIQLRGTEISKSSQFYGPSFTHSEVLHLLEDLPVTLIREEGLGQKYYWITFVRE